MQARERAGRGAVAARPLVEERGRPGPERRARGTAGSAPTGARLAALERLAPNHRRRLSMASASSVRAKMIRRRTATAT